MKSSFVFVALLFLLTSCKSQNHFQTVFDNENDLTPSQIQKLDSLYKDHKGKTSNEIVLVTVPDFGRDATIEDFGL